MKQCTVYKIINNEVRVKTENDMFDMGKTLRVKYIRKRFILFR